MDKAVSRDGEVHRGESSKSVEEALNAGKMKPERVEKFRKLLELTGQYRRKNQYE